MFDIMSGVTRLSSGRGTIEKMDYRPRSKPTRRTTILVIVIALVFAAASLYTLYETRNTVTPSDRIGTGQSPGADVGPPP